MSLKIDHIVITVKDINKSISFYSNILEMELKEFFSLFDNTTDNYWSPSTIALQGFRFFFRRME